MRDKYIELIKEYVKVKPDYRYLLDDLKREVITVGATEEEFDEAVRQITNIPDTSPGFVSPKKKRIDTQKIKQTVIFTAKHLTHKGRLTAVILSVVLIFATIGMLRSSGPPQSVRLTKSTVSPTKPSAPKQDILPVVYANLQPVDADKIFSIPSSNVKLTITGSPKKEVLGFFPYWMVTKQDKINLSTLTSVSYFGLDVDTNGNIVKIDGDKPSTGWAMWQDESFNQFVRRAKNQGIRIYLTFKSFNSSTIEAISKSDEAHKNFIANAVYLVNSKNLDGINIDFEYLGAPDDKVRDGFSRLIANLNYELKRQIPTSSLTIDTYLVSGAEDGIFNLPFLSQNSDGFVIMGYDMHTPNGGPGPVSAMGGPTNIVGYVQNYLEKVGSDKLILAVPYYGYDWPQNAETPSSDNVNILPYAEIADISKNLNLAWNDTSETPYYTYKDSEGDPRIVHFDNVRSLGIKYDFINKKDLKGVGIWALGYDGQNQDLEKLLIDKFINQ